MDWLTNFFMNSGGGLTGLPTVDPTTLGGGGAYGSAPGGPVGLPAEPAGGFAGPGGPSIGESLSPAAAPLGEVPMPRPRPQPGGPAATPAAPADAAAAQGGGGLAGILRGVQAPPRPDVVKPATPHGPPIQHIQGGALLSLLQNLYPQLARPAPISTLGGGLGIGRY